MADPGDETKPEEPEPDDEEWSDRLVGFVNLGFDSSVAMVLADKHISPSDVRERFLKKGCPHNEAARILL